MKDFFSRAGRSHPLHLLIWGYIGYTVVGWCLLLLPVCHEAQTATALDHLFVATSAISTTGLSTVDVPGTYSFLGELVIFIGFQLGGLGYMTLGSFILLAGKRVLTPAREQVARVAFTLPEGFEISVFLMRVVRFTLLIEAVGAVLLFFAFRAAGVEKPLWHAVFHSVSAFCTAGFSIFPTGLEAFRTDFWVNVIVSVLSILGAVGFLAMSDVWEAKRGKRERTTLTTRIILQTTLWSIGIGWALLFLTDAGMAKLPGEERLLASMFQSISALTTAGFNTYPISQVTASTTLILIVLMIMGASPAGTGGGLKSTSVSAAWAVLWSTLHGRSEITFWGKKVPAHRLFTAFAALVFYVATYLIGSTLLLLVENHQFEDVLFEAASALGTVGLSRGITGDLSHLGVLMVTSLMFIGRIGPLTFGLALFSGTVKASSGEEEEDLAV